MLVNTDERRHAWMDEGFNTFINKYSTQDWFPNSKPQQARVDRRHDAFARACRS
jgi:hypothetical protein